MSKTGARVILVSILLFALGVAFCNSFRPDDEKVRDEFLEQNPGVEVISLYVGEGDFDNAWYHIIYKNPSESHVQEKIVLYQREGREWKTNYNLKVP